MIYFFETVYSNGCDHFVLRNASVQLTVSKGRITSLVDVKLKWVVFPFLVSPGSADVVFFSRELIPQGMTGGLVIFQDRPNAFDAWGELSTYVWTVSKFFELDKRC